MSYMSSEIEQTVISNVDRSGACAGGANVNVKLIIVRPSVFNLR